MSEREAIVGYLRNWSAGLLDAAITEYAQPSDWQKLNCAARAIDGIARHIENGDHCGDAD